MTPTEFIMARIAEDGAAAQSALDLRGSGTDWPNTHPLDPARVLAECAAKRQIVELYNYATESGEGSEGGVVALDAAMHILAAIYADHPDYREEWAL